MKKMIKTQKYLEKQLYLNRYSNGQLAVFVLGHMRDPIAELSIMNDSIDLAPNEFILKDYSENMEFAKEFIDSHRIIPIGRYVLIGAHLCPICKIES